MCIRDSNYSAGVNALFWLTRKAAQSRSDRSFWESVFSEKLRMDWRSDRAFIIGAPRSRSEMCIRDSSYRFL